MLLLDRRLLKGEISKFDLEGKVETYDHMDHCATTVHPRGDGTVTWLMDRSAGEDVFKFLKP
ncbi:unnamed protein product, partial [Arabidopsis halleri]